MTATIWRPSVPYIIQSGKRKGKALELLMFDDYSFLVWWHRVMKQNVRRNGGQKNEAHKHLEWLFERGENRVATHFCPRCRQQAVAFISVVQSCSGEVSIGQLWTCCDSEVCMKIVASEAFDKPQYFIPLKFSSMNKFASRYYQRQVAGLLRWAFDLPDRLTRQRAFDFFSA